MTQDELLTLMNAVAIDAKASLMFNGHLKSTFIVKAGDRCEMLPYEFNNEDKKEDVAAALALYTDMIQAECVIHVSEAWMSTAQPDGKLPSVNPTDDPNRREILVIAGAIPSGETLIGCAFTRNGKEITLGDDLPEADFVPRQSRFFWLLWSGKGIELSRQRWQC
ncbi:hypothetical protein OR1_04084 [Geobacter sp. OR-1]|uniref:hypothetical protein n=1 Tax=Geobacter sp. OR-1 TaxID=1266765 RepID=UPI0005424D2D|nr:hypothetical protein [Geobacter sp. OR-1]GAM11766.1 hypothetical protein OR1_04084 [Geobacter sp. OR-1]